MGPNMLVKGVLLTIVFALFGWVAPLGAQEATFTDLHDVVPNRCFSAPLSTVGADFVDIGIESGFDSATWVNKACKASTSAFHTRTAGDTFSVTVTAPPGMRITRVTYAQAGTRYLERSTYWTASGTGTLTVNGVPLVLQLHDPDAEQDRRPRGPGRRERHGFRHDPPRGRAQLQLPSRDRSAWLSQDRCDRCGDPGRV